MERNYKLEITYDGTHYFGWEHQPNVDTIQGKIENVLSLMIGGQPVEVIGAGRTDAGVHALKMVANVHLDTKFTEDEIRDYMNKYLPTDICINSVIIASERFHARYNAIGKTYRYTCYIGNLKPVFDRKYVTILDYVPDISLMKEAANLIMGTHDFACFCDNPKMKKSTVRTIDRIEIYRKKDYLYFEYHGDGFLQHMVRIMTGTLLEIGRGLKKPDDITAIIDSKNRWKAGPAMPAQGLTLIQVDYN